MTHVMNFLVSISSVVNTMFRERPSIAQRRSPQWTTSIVLCLYMAVVVVAANAHANAPSLSMAHHYHSVDTRITASRSLWRNPQNKNPITARDLQFDPHRSNQAIQTNHLQRTLEETQNTESTKNDESLNGSSSNNNNNNEDASNDDVTVVVPLNFARGEIIDDEVFSEDPKDTHEADGQRMTWICVVLLVGGFSTSGFLWYRKRARSRRREYRTHRILQEHVEAFDLSFRDDDENDDVELSNF